MFNSLVSLLNILSSSDMQHVCHNTNTTAVNIAVHMLCYKHGGLYNEYIYALIEDAV